MIRTRNRPCANYHDYYMNQVGHGGPVYAGTRVQRGSGLGNIFGGMIRAAIPILKRGAKTLGKSAVKTGMRVVSDIASGQGFKSSLKRRAGETLGAMLTSAPSSNKPSAPKRSRGKTAKRGARGIRGGRGATRRRTQRNDIFS